MVRWAGKKKEARSVRAAIEIPLPQRKSADETHLSDAPIHTQPHLDSIVPSLTSVLFPSNRLNAFLLDRSLSWSPTDESSAGVEGCDPIGRVEGIVGVTEIDDREAIEPGRILFQVPRMGMDRLPPSWLLSWVRVLWSTADDEDGKDGGRLIRSVSSRRILRRYGGVSL